VKTMCATVFMHDRLTKCHQACTVCLDDSLVLMLFTSVVFVLALANKTRHKGV
jgi:hypothetical protein